MVPWGGQMTGPTQEQTQLAKQVLADVAELQARFWERLGVLESLLGIELVSTTDYTAATVESLLQDDEDDNT